jgi:hypothetical protein
MNELERTAVQGAMIGVVCAVLLIAYIVITGQTFGQRCAKMHPKGDGAAISRCVHQLRYQH